MKSRLRLLVVTIGIFCAATGFAQTATPVTKASAPANTSAAPAAKTPAAPMAKTAASAAAKTAVPTTAAVGGREGKVWVNTKSKTYHCEGTKFYGKTKTGEYMTETDAKAKGNHADHAKACVK